MMLQLTFQRFTQCLCSFNDLLIAFNFDFGLVQFSCLRLHTIVDVIKFFWSLNVMLCNVSLIVIFCSITFTIEDVRVSKTVVMMTRWSASEASSSTCLGRRLLWVKFWSGGCVCAGVVTGNIFIRVV